MTLANSAFEARTDMLERTRAASNGAPRVVRIKNSGGEMGISTRERAPHARMRGCERTTAGLRRTRRYTKGRGEDCVAGSLTDPRKRTPPDPRKRTRRGDVHSARLPPLHKRLVHGVSSPHHELERLGERDITAASLGHVNHADKGALRCAV